MQIDTNIRHVCRTTLHRTTMKLVIIPAEKVAANPNEYNSVFHGLNKVPDLLAPSEAPVQFSRWLPLIAKSQRIDPSRIQTITLTRAQGRLLLEASRSTVHTHVLNSVYEEELVEELVPSAFGKLVFPADGLFLRLDASSPKDAVGGTKPLLDASDIPMRLTSSFRAHNALQNILNNESPDAPEIKLHFLPYNNRMSTAYEFRVFCAPPSCDITAISQYRWHKACTFENRLARHEIEEIVRRIQEETHRIRAEIIGHTRHGSEMYQLLLLQGFSSIFRTARRRGLAF